MMNRFRLRYDTLHQPKYARNTKIARDRLHLKSKVKVLV